MKYKSYFLTPFHHSLRCCLSFGFVLDSSIVSERLNKRGCTQIVRFGFSLQALWRICSFLIKAWAPSELDIDMDNEQGKKQVGHWQLPIWLHVHWQHATNIVPDKPIRSILQIAEGFFSFGVRCVPYLHTYDVML